MGILFVIVAAILVSISNLCMRRSIDAGGSSKAYLVVQLSISFFVMIALNPIRTGNFAWGGGAVALGLLGGLLFGLLMWGLGKSLETGPPGLSFAFLNVASILPAIAMALLFGAAYGHEYTSWNAVGSGLVALGLFWAGWTSDKNPQKGIWLFFVFFILVMHALFLSFLQWWALLLNADLPPTPLIPFHIDVAKTEWFMPAVVFVAALIQVVIYARNQRRLPKGAEVYYGIAGGITNGACTFFLILAPQKALAWENPMLFPIFSISVILLCNAWAQLLYQESVNWKTNTLCVIGLLLGTVAWHSL